MPIVTLEQVKAHLRYEDTDEDALIQQKIAAAQSHIERLLGFKLDEETYPDTDEFDFPETVPAALVECICQLAAHWFENREAVLVGVSGQQTPINLDDVIREFRNWSWAG